VRAARVRRRTRIITSRGNKRHRESKKYISKSENKWRESEGISQLAKKEEISSKRNWRRK
jgi:hypothetical protein